MRPEGVALTKARAGWGLRRNVGSEKRATWRFNRDALDWREVRILISTCWTWRGTKSPMRESFWRRCRSFGARLGKRLRLSSGNRGPAFADFL